jgi:hypothetical protein
MQWNMDHSRHNIGDVAAGYAALPKYDPKAEYAWKQLAEESKEHADYIKQHLNVTETEDPEPYDTSEDMIRDIRNNRNFIVSTANADHPIWTPQDNINFRIVHDVFGHAATEGDFGWHGENDACSTHFALSSPHAQKALATECLGQTGYAIDRGGFTDQRVGFIPGLHEGLSAANEDTPVPTRAQLMQRALYGPQKESKWKMAQDANRMYRQHTDGPPAAETTFESIQNEDTSDEHEDEIKIINGKKWRIVRRKNNPQPDTYKDPIGGWGFYSKLLDEMEKQSWVVVSSEKATPIDVRNIDEYEIPSGYAIVHELVPNFARYGVIPIAEIDSDALTRSLTEVPSGMLSKDRFYLSQRSQINHNISFWDPEKLQIVYGMEYNLNHPELFNHYVETDPLEYGEDFSDPNDLEGAYSEYKNPTYVESIHYNVPATYMDGQSYYPGSRIYLQKLNEQGHAKTYYPYAQETVDNFNQRYPRLSLAVLRWMKDNLPTPIGADIVNPKLKEKAQKQDFVSLSKWKISVPPAEKAEEFGEGYEKAPAPSAEEIEERYKYNKDPRGHRWQLNKENLERLYNHPEWPLESKYNVFPLSLEQAQLKGREKPDLTHWNRAALGTHESPQGKNRSGFIYINPLISPESANEALWHELQHAYQHQEERFTKELRDAYFDPTKIDPSLTDEEVAKKFEEEYVKHPMEIDANLFADFMRRYPIIEESDPVYKENWVGRAAKDMDIKDAIDKYYQEYGSKRRLPLPSIKSKWMIKEAPARSKAQFRYMQAICNGSIKPPKGMTRAQACEYVEGQSPKDLPEKKSKLDMQQEMEQSLIKAGFSQKAAILIALDNMSKLSYWVDGYHATVALRDPDTDVWHMDVGFNDKLTHGGVTADYINDLGTKAMRKAVADKDSRTDYYNYHTARGLYNPVTKDFIHMSHPDFWNEAEYNFKHLDQDERDRMEAFWRQLAEQNNIELDSIRVLNNQTGHLEDLNVADLEMPEEVSREMRMRERKRPLTPWEIAQGGYDTKTGSIKKRGTYFPGWYSTTLIPDEENGGYRMILANHEGMNHWNIHAANGTFPDYRGLYNPELKEVIHLSSPTEYVKNRYDDILPNREALDATPEEHQKVWMDAAKKPVDIIEPAGEMGDYGPVDENGKNPNLSGLLKGGDKLNVVDKKHIPIGSVHVMHKRDIPEESPEDFKFLWNKPEENYKHEYQITFASPAPKRTGNKKEAHWIEGFSAAIINQHGKMEVAPPGMVIVDGNGNVIDEDDTWHATHWDIGGYPQYRGLYNHKTGELIHMTSSEEHENMSPGYEYLSKDEAINPLEHETYWRDAANQSNIPIRDFKLMYEKDADEYGDEPLKKLWHGENKKEDFNLLDSEEFMPKVSKWKKKGHWLEDYYAAIITPNGEMRVAKDWNHFHGSLFSDLGLRKYHRGLYNKDTGELLHMTTPEEWNKLQNSWDYSTDDTEKQWPLGFEWFNSPEHFISPYKTEKEWLKAAEDADIPVSEVKMFSGEPERNPYVGYDVNRYNRHSPAEVAQMRMSKWKTSKEDAWEAVLDGELGHDILTTGSWEEVKKQTLKWLKQLKNGYINKKNPHDNKKIDPEAKEQDGHAIEDLKLYEEKKRWSFHFDHGKHPYDLIIQPVGYKESKWKKKSHWIEGFHAAVIDPDGKMHIAGDWEDIHQQTLIDNGWIGSDLSKSYRGLYNPDTGELFHMTSPVEKMTFGEYATSPNHLSDIENHEDVWREAASKSGVPVNDFKGLYKVDEYDEDGWRMDPLWYQKNPKEMFGYISPKQSKWRKKSHWVDGYHAAVITGDGKMFVSDDPHHAHIQALPDKEQGIALMRRDYWRGLYNPETKTILHMSDPHEYEKMRTEQVEIAPDGGGILTQDDDYYDDKWRTAAEEANIPVEDVKLLKWNTSEDYPSWNNSNRSNSPEQFKISDLKLSKVGKWKKAEKKKRKMHPKFQTSLNDHQRSVRKYGPLKTHKTRKFKKRSSLSEEQSRELFQYEPNMYHDVAAARSKEELNDQINTVRSILQNGILPKEQTGISEYDDWLTSRPDHVYLGRKNFYSRKRPPAIKIDMSKVDPSTIKPDEDIYHAFGFSDRGVDMFNLKSMPFEEEHKNNPDYTLGQWMEDHSHLDTPNNVFASHGLNNSLAVKGGVPSDALSINDEWVDYMNDRYGIDILKLL